MADRTCNIVSYQSMEQDMALFLEEILESKTYKLSIVINQ